MFQMTTEILTLWRDARHGRVALVPESLPEGLLIEPAPIPNPWAPASPGERCRRVLPRSGRAGRVEFHRCKRRGVRFCWQHQPRGGTMAEKGSSR